MAVNNENNTTTESSVAVQDKQFNTVEIRLRRLNKDDTIAFTRSTALIYVRGGKGYAFFKRLFDIFCSLLAIIILSPILIVTAILVKITSRGPILFKDYRVGRYGKEIKLWKFRSMYVDAESKIKQYLTKEEYERWLVERKLDNDPRITPLGKIIRKTSIDELPQLFNILFGSISFIGPRPITRMEWHDHFTKEQREALLCVKPGLSGYWAAYARSEATFETGDRQKLEMEYLKRRSFWFDIKLVFVTILSVFKRKGAK